MSTDLIEMWHQRARPEPTQEQLEVQLGCHLEEIREMMECFSVINPETDTAMPMTSNLIYTILHAMGEGLKNGTVKVAITNRKGFLDSLCDQVVTGVGVGHCAKMKITEAIHRVNDSNWSKYVDGKPVFNENGKIAKGPHYKEPDLEGLY